VASTTTLRRHVQVLEESTTARYAAASNAGKQRRYTEFYDGAGSWSRVERIIARVEAGPEGVDTRFVVTNLTSGTPRRLYERTYCQRGQAENHLKAWKRHLAADRTSCSRSSANQLRLMLHTGAYWLLWSVRSLMPKRSSWRVAQFDTLRLRLVKGECPGRALHTATSQPCDPHPAAAPKAGTGDTRPPQPARKPH
jgi:hypothetical protein